MADNPGLRELIRGVVREELSDPTRLPQAFKTWLPSFASLNQLQHGHRHLNESDDPIPFPVGSATAASSTDTCYPVTLTTVSSVSGSSTYQEYLSFTVPADDARESDVIELTLACELLNTSGVDVWLVQQLDWGTTSLFPYPTDSYTKWKNNLGAKYLYRFLFMFVPNPIDNTTHVWMSDLRSQWGPYSMGLGSDAPFPVGASVDFNALEFGAHAVSDSQTVVFRASWTKAPAPTPADGGVTLTPLTARARRFGCPNEP